MEKTNGICLLILFFGCVGAEDNKSGYCLNLPKTWGFTVPPGDIILKYGQSLNITCNLLEKTAKNYGENASSYLFFTRNLKPVPKDKVEIINSTSIRLYIEKPAKVESDNYFCNFNETAITKNKTNEKLICVNNVAVGVAPQNVTDFSCIGRNFDNLTCSWEMPNNYIETEYELAFSLSKGKARKLMHPCPELTIVGNTMSCFWNISTKPQYRPVHPTFVFFLNMTNVFGSFSWTFDFDHFKHVVPNPPENLSAVSTSPHSIHLSWRVPSVMEFFEPGLHHRILFQCVYYDKIWHVGGYIEDDVSKKNMTLEFDLINLKYAHALCDIRVSMRSAAAKGDETMWSKYSSVNIWTQTDIPDCPPRSVQGAFEIVNNQLHRDAYVYWQKIDENQMNGNTFSYEVVVDNNSNLRPTELTKTFAKFTNLPPSKHEISIWSKNELGKSLQKSTVIIPETRLTEPLNFIKLEHPGPSDEIDLYEFTWDPPKSSERKITNYTLFWCENDRDRPHQCTGFLNWTVVPGDVHRYNLSLNKIKFQYQFAISANSEDSSSGMSWAECTLIADKVVGKMRNVWINLVGSDFIELGWKLECTDGIRTVLGYVIYYCPIRSTQEKECTKDMQSVTINGTKNTHSGRVTKLKPYTMYLLTVSVIMSHNTYSQSSDTMRNTTREAAPSTPRIDASSFNVTNSSISLKWSPPTEMNGVLKYYRIHYKSGKDVKSQELDKSLNNFTITGLKSFENYSISMQACTIECSETSQEEHVVTKMEIPGVIERPNVIFQNDTVTTIGWKKPDPPGGEINYYQVKFTHNNLDNNISMEPDVNVTGTQNYSIEDCGESGKYNTFFVSIRAVNIIDGVHSPGPWSEPLESYCRHYSPLLYVIICVAMIFLAAVLCLGFRKMYIRYKVMQNVEMMMPPGLALVMEQRDLVLWGSEKNPDDIDRSSRSDEQQLLGKICEIRNSGDSSGCSSGHESITSSLDSTHMSIDSGTDQPRNMNEENRRNSLRQRNVSSKGYVLPDAVQMNNWGSKSAPAPAENYCVLGVDPTNKEADSQYQPITDISSSISTPYISCDLPPNLPPTFLLTADLIKTPNPGYVPYSATEPASKNTGYVVAGITKDLLEGDIHQCEVKNPTLDDKPYVKLGEATPGLIPQYSWNV